MNRQLTGDGDESAMCREFGDEPEITVLRNTFVMDLRGRKLFAVAALVAAAGVLSPGCSDKSHRLREGEALQYKRELLQARPRDLNPQYIERFLYDPARTKSAINATFDDYAKKSAEEQDVTRAQYAKERSPGGGSSATTSAPAGTSATEGASESENTSSQAPPTPRS